MNLDWTKRKAKLAGRRLRTSQWFDAGVSCLYVPLTRKTGLKIYNTLEDRELSFKMQHRAWQYYLGPRVGQKVSITDFDLVKKIYELRKGYYDPSQHLRCEWHAFVTEAATMRRTTERKLEDLAKRLRENGFSDTDIDVDHNVGYVRGKLVCIDFDPVSMNAAGKMSEPDYDNLNLKIAQWKKAGGNHRALAKAVRAQAQRRVATPRYTTWDPYGLSDYYW